MHQKFTNRRLLLGILLLYLTPVMGQLGIGTLTPDPNSILDIFSTTKGLLIPRLSTSQQATLASTLTSAEAGMIVADAATGRLMGWNGDMWTDIANLSASTPLTISSTNQLSLNAGTQTGDLITWDGANWVNMQPAVQHFSFTVDNRQPYLTVNYCIALQGIFPARSDAVPFVSQIQLFPLNFAPKGWAFCNGQLLAISSNTALFSLLGTNFGGNGLSTFQLPDLQGRVPIGFGQGPGLSNYQVGQSGGEESQTISR